MLTRAFLSASSAPSMITRRGFQSTPKQLSSPYHYPEGPRSNIPFNPLTKYFAYRYWGFMGMFPPHSLAMKRMLINWNRRWIRPAVRHSLYVALFYVIGHVLLTFTDWQLHKNK